MNDPHFTATTLQTLEEQLLEPTTRSNPEAVAALLADDFREFGSSGRTFTKAEILAKIASESPVSIILSNFACQTLAPDLALVTYRSTSTAERTQVTVLRSSLWVFRNQRWQMLFHQGTRAATQT